MKTKTVPDLFRKEREEWLIDCRREAKKLLKHRSYITIEDVLRACPRPQYIKPNTVGQVFKDPAFKSVGFSRSVRPVSNGRYVQRWALIEHQVNYRIFRRIMK